MHKVITFGEIMMRLSTPDFQRFSQANSFDVVYGGSESNVAVSLANHGIASEFITRLPDNDIGKCAMMDLRKHGVGVENVVWGGDRLGLYFLERGAVARGSKVIYDRSHSSISEITKDDIDWKKAFEGATWFHWSGITPAISKNAAEVCLQAVKIAKEMNLTVSMDFNFRIQLWQYCTPEERNYIMKELVSHTDIVFGTELDANLFFDIQPKTTDDSKHAAFQSICDQMMAQFPNIKKIIKSVRGTYSASHNSWSGVLYDGKNLYDAPTYEITDIVDRVGGGDSFVGGLIYGLLTYVDEPKKALEFAVAASCLKHTITGDVNLASVAEVEKLMNGDSTGKVVR